ncbi:MAG: rRNA pseudouridine synthase [Chloroflexi bacterium]|nr:rRNA pseudouridine synthase [Chloroflexota bacterium]
MKARLQKLLAQAGHGSRRSAEALIADGRVSVNGAVVTVPGTQADPDIDVIAVDGVRLEFHAQSVYLVMNKPRGVISTARDPQGRRTVMDLLPPGLPPHVLPVGRLDRDTEGLLIFTDDGEFAHRLAHPRFETEKEYLALVSGAPDEAALQRLREGVEIEGVRTSPAAVERSRPPEGYAAREGYTWLQITIHEGRKRQVRLMCAAVGHQVRTLVRTRIGGVVVGRLPAAKTRPLSAREVSDLRAAVGL